MSTAPATAPESATRIRTAPTLVLAAMALGLSAAEAIALQQARSAEAARLAAMGGVR